MQGRDIIGSAQTGTGKTAAVRLADPLEGRWPPPQFLPRVLVLEPTRELAAQVETAFRDFARFTDLRITVVFGGVGYGRQRESLRDGTDVVIATPGRLLDLMNQGACRLDRVQYLVLDEADRMLDMGFLPDVRRIVQKCPRERHSSLFSATVPRKLKA
jgi:ATP-dependent RNA helicase RhlE